MATSWRTGLVLSLWSIATAVLGQLPQSETLMVRLSRQTVGDVSGSTIGADWIGRIDSSVYSLGLDALRVADSHWWLLKGSASRSLGSRWTVSGGAEAGPAILDGGRETILKLRAGADLKVSDNWYLHVEDAYFDVTPVSGQLVTLGATWLRPRMSWRAQLATDLGGNIDERTAMLRADIPLPRWQLFSGLAHGQSNNKDLLSRLVVLEPVQRTRSFFVGASMPLGDLRLGVTLDSVRSGSVTRHGLALSLSKNVNRVLQ